MNKNCLAIAVSAALIAGVAFSAVLPGDCGERRRSVERSKAEVVPSRLNDSDATIDFAMQWDNASKKLLFDGQAVCHDKPTGFKLNGCNITVEKQFVTPPTRPDEYSFDAAAIGGFNIVRDPSVHNGRVCFCVEWDEWQERFSIRETSPQPKAEIFMFNTGTGWR
jgi:hypothetical protein